ncbi:MAG: type II toxin-antitoxin system RelB/DinJ family antitoxin [Synergistaceae bacterium]|nr:type II toxin-antitoxin system RelB/DinJ family antitoxin [Synergistaceae bacterium]
MSTAAAEKKTNSYVVELEPEIYEQGEYIFNKMGLSYSQAVDLFTRQVILHKEIPFKLSVPVKDEKLPEDDPELLKKYGIRCLEDLTDEDFDAMLKQADEDHKAGRFYSLEEAKKMWEEEWNAIISR